MHAGRLIHRIDIQTLTHDDADSTGAQEEVWSNLRTSVPAEVRYLGAEEQLRAKAVQSDATVLVTIRYDADVSAAVRFKYGTKYLYPTAVIPGLRNIWLTCMCREQL